MLAWSASSLGMYPIGFTGEAEDREGFLTGEGEGSVGGSGGVGGDSTLICSA
jgi:hypothetical protein